MNAEVLSKHEARFLDWLEAKHPRLKEHILIQAGNGQLSGFLDTLSSTINNVITGATKAVDTYVSSKSQVDLVKINWQRAKDGLPLFNTAEEARAAMGGGLSTGAFSPASLFKSPFFWIAIGGVAYLLLRGRGKRT